VRVLSPGAHTYYTTKASTKTITDVPLFIGTSSDAGERDFNVLQVAALLYLKKLDELNEDGKARLAASEAVRQRSGH
jgi:hypothetical protein